MVHINNDICGSDVFNLKFEELMLFMSDDDVHPSGAALRRVNSFHERLDQAFSFICILTLAPDPSHVLLL